MASLSAGVLTAALRYIDELRGKLAYWQFLWLGIGLCFAATCQFVPWINPGQVRSLETARAFLSAAAGLLATVFAVVIAVTLVAFEILRGKYRSLAASTLLDLPPIRDFFFSYLLAICFCLLELLVLPASPEVMTGRLELMTLVCAYMTGLCLLTLYWQGRLAAQRSLLSWSDRWPGWLFDFRRSD